MHWQIYVIVRPYEAHDKIRFPVTRTANGYTISGDKSGKKADLFDNSEISTIIEEVTKSYGTTFHKFEIQRANT